MIGQSGSPPGGAHLHLEMRYYRNPSLPKYQEASPLIGDNSVGLPYPAHGVPLSANIQNGQYTSYTVRAQLLAGTKNGLNYNGNLTYGSDRPRAGTECTNPKQVTNWIGIGGTIVASDVETPSNVVTGSTNVTPPPSQVLVQNAWTTDANGNQITTYAPNQYIGFSTTINNTTGSTVACTLVGQATGSRQIMFQTQDVSLPPGTSQQSLPGTIIPSDTWQGKYFFRLQVICGSLTPSGLASNFTVTAQAPSTYIVLTWPAFRRDLDSHLWLPAATPAHIWYQNLGNLNVSPDAALDKDDVSGSGMETIAISQLFPGTYYYAVYNYANTGTISGSYIGVRLYQNGVITHEIQAPSTGKAGRWWNVFRLTVGTGGSVTVTTVNKIIATCPGPYDCPTAAAMMAKG